MSSKTKTAAAKNDGKPALTPKLRFPAFREAAGWEIGKVDELVDTVTPPKKLPTSLYSSKGAFPIIDQSQADICGWTDDHEALIQDGLPLIIFGDHTCILKLIDRPFAQGADGIKILKSRPKVGTPFLYQFLTYRPVVTEEYKRHYSILKEKLVSFPDPKTGEQQKIAECLSSVDELMAAQARKLDALKTHKKGLMQQLFPREGETQPGLRFPEFQNAGEWEVRKAGTFFSNRVTKGEQGLLIYSVTMHDGMVRRDSLDRNYYDIEDAAGNKKVCRNDIAYNMMRMWQGAFGVAPEDCLVSPAYIVLAPAKGTVPEFFQYMLKLPATLLTLTSHSRGLTKDRLRLYYDDFARIPLRCPSPDEQQRIASCLTSLDDLIAAQTQKLAALKIHKQGLMQQLFPSSGGVAGEA